MTYEELKKAYEEMSKKCALLEKENEKKDETIEHLEELLLKRNKMLFGRKSEKSKYLQCDGQESFEGVFNEAEMLSDETAEEPTEETIVVKRKSQKTGEHRGKNKLREDLPKEKIVSKLPENKCNCAVCGSKLKVIKEEFLTSKLVYIPEQLKMREFYRTVYKCECCDKKGEDPHIVKSENPTPAQVIPKGLPDQTLVADIMQRKYQLGTPLDRQEKYWAAQGVYLSRTSMANWVIEGSKWFEPVIDMLWKYSYKEPVLNADETTSRTLKTDKGKKIDKLGQMWICSTGRAAKKKIAIYEYRDSRTKAVAEELYYGYTGILQTDGFQSYGSGSYTRVGCWSHARRKLIDCIPEKHKKSKAAIAVGMIDKMFKYEREARKEDYSDEQLLEMRREKIAPLVDEFYKFIDSLHPGNGSHLAEAVNYARNQKAALTVFLNNPLVDMSNNLAERTVKPYIIARKNFLFSCTEKGAHASAAVMTIIETAKRNGLDVYGYLLHLLTELPKYGHTPTREQLEALMPWSDSLPDFCKKKYSQLESVTIPEMSLCKAKV